MNHEDAVREFSVERYLLGELSGEPRDKFEEHLFECQECASDIKSGVTFLEASNEQLAVTTPERLKVTRGSRFAWLLSPSWMIPALAVCLAVIGYDTVVLLPGARVEVARANAPAVLNTINLAAGTSRGTDMKQVRAPRSGSFLISFDIPMQSDYARYRCSLYSPARSLVWQGDISSEQAKDSVLLRIPASAKNAGVNEFLIEGVRSDDKLVELSKYQFLVQLEN